MMGNYAAYASYKDSGVEWLGEIPEHWEVKRIKLIGSIKYGLGEPPEKLDDGIPIIRATDIYRGIIDGSKVQRVNPDKVPWSRNPELKIGDILVVRSGAYTGDSAIVPTEWAGSIAGYDMVLTPTKAAPKYIAWNLLGRHILEGQLYLAKSRAAQPHLNAEELGNTILATPPLDEQRAIAAFLDYKTQQIDQLIAKKEALLEKLDEKRTALISHAVTKGIDPTVPMKNSGVEWLGDIPEHWNFRRIKFIGNIKYGLGEPPEKLDDGLPIIRATDIYRGVIDGSKVQRVNPDKVPWSRNPELKTGDILVVRSGAYTGDSAIVPSEWAGSIAGYDMVLTPTKSYPKYIAWNLLGKHILEGQLYLAKSRAAQPHLNAEELGNTILAIPSLDEQKIIAEYLEKKTTEIDQQKEKILQAIDLLKEYRTALITNAVTGKIDVRSVPIPTP